MLFFSPSCCLWVFNCGILLLTLKLPQLGWSEVYCCYEGNVFTLERCFIWLALKGFFQQQFHFQKYSRLHRVGKQGNQRNTFSDSMLYFLLIRMTLKFCSLETRRRTYFCFSDQEKKKRNTLSDVWNTLGAIPARRGMLWVANRSGSCKAGCPRCVVFNRASLASLALLCLNSLYLLKSNYQCSVLGLLPV